MQGSTQRVRREVADRREARERMLSGRLRLALRREHRLAWAVVELRSMLEQQLVKDRQHRDGALAGVGLDPRNLNRSPSEVDVPAVERA
jgi:hypothetical protein